MKVAIIGSNGLLSSEMGMFCTKRNDTISVYGMDVPKSHQFTHFYPINLMCQDIDMKILTQNDMIIYAAGAGIQSNQTEDYESIYYLNTFLPIKICKVLATQEYKGTFVTFGSYFEIGSNNEDRLFDETELANSCLPVPNNYAISKRLLTRFVGSNNSNFKHLHLILPTIYGPDEADHRLIPYTLSMIDKGEKPQFTAGIQVRQYLYIGDVPSMVFALFNRAQQGVFNVFGSSTQCFTVKEMVELIYKEQGKTMPEGVFGKVKRADVLMENLQLNNKKVLSILPDFLFTPLLEVLPKY